MTTEHKRKRSLSSSSSKDAPRIAGLYDLERTIGQGHFAVVKLARHVFTGEKVAVKVIDKNNLDPLSTTHLMQEVRCMKLVQHPNIVRLYEVIDTTTKMFLILELGDYDMHDFIIKHEKGCPEPLAQQYFSQIITAINYCHKLHVVHRDLKPENVVFFEKLGMVKLTDFGFSNLFEPGQQLQTSCGSLAYSAPEILLGDRYDAPAVDVWSLGVILYMLVCGRLPFQETNDSETLTKILDCKYSLPETLSNPCRNLISRMLVKDPPKRSTLEEIAASPWVMAGDRGHAEALPLIVRQHLPQSAHTTIVEQMVNGKIGSEDAILSALENGEYNYLSATYYLLAERVLSSIREQQAKTLAERRSDIVVPDEPPIDGDAQPSSRPSSARCRSRSNSFRASVRRPCTILKEESEEELSSYLRSSSRQSSRFFIPREDSTGSSAGTGQEEVASGEWPSISRPISVEHLAHRYLTAPVIHEDLSPIMENNVEGKEEEEGIRQLRAHSESANQRADKNKLIRRNSSPSVSMFGINSRDRVSPQALQELLELSRISGRRAASPDSIRSSRSPSPGSGRTSPATSLLSSLTHRLKTPTVIAGGMRKLSSSPHLLGICEEAEEQADGSGHSLEVTDGVARTNRSASTGVVFNPGCYPALLSPSPSLPSKSSATLSPAAMTYSAVRMIRPRQAVVSPDVCRRYDQHQRYITRSRRSTSCSSSEASDDEEGRRLTMISRNCRKPLERRDGEDDGDGDGGVAGPSRGKPSSGPTTNGTETSEGGGQQTNGGTDGRTGGEGTTKVARSLEVPSPVTLRPIPEMTHLDSDRPPRIRAGFWGRSATAERVVMNWTETEEEESIHGTPPRTTSRGGQKWIRQIQRTRSYEDIRERDEENWEDDCSEAEDEVPDEWPIPSSPSISSSISSCLALSNGSTPCDSAVESTDSGLPYLQRRKKMKPAKERSDLWKQLRCPSLDEDDEEDQVFSAKENLFAKRFSSGRMPSYGELTEREEEVKDVVAEYVKNSQRSPSSHLSTWLSMLAHSDAFPHPFAPHLNPTITHAW